MRVRPARVLSASCILSLAACGGASFRDGVYRDELVRYRVGALPGYSRIEVDDNDLAFHAKGVGTISVNSTCTEYDDVPVAALVNHLLFETSERRFVVDETITLDGRGARHAIVHAELDGVPLELELLVMKKDGCVFDLTHVRDRRASEAARQTFVQWASAFTVLDVYDDD